MENVENNASSDKVYPVLRLANPARYPNDNDNNIYYDNYQNDNVVEKTSTMPTTKTTTVNKINNQTSNVTNLTGIVTNMHPLMSPPISISLSPDFPDLIPEKSKHSSTKYATYKQHSNNTSPSFTKNTAVPTKFTFQTTNTYTSHLNDIVPASSSIANVKSSSASDSSDTENDNSTYEATLCVNEQNVSLKMNEKPIDLGAPIHRRRLRVGTHITYDDDDSDDDDDDYDDDSLDSTQINTNIIRDLLESSGEVINFNTDKKIEEYSAVDERRDSRNWQKITLPTGERRNIDMRVIEPYKRILSHGGYLKTAGDNAIIVFSACFLPDKSRKDYDYVMDNLFLYVLSTLDQLVTDDYVLVYLHGGASRGARPTLSWIKKCYELVDRKLRKNLKQLYIVHPTIWVRTLLLFCKPFLSSKFYKKINYVHSLRQLGEMLPVECAAIPDKVKNYEQHKFSC